MSKSNYLENAILALLFNGTALADLAENDATSPLTTLYVALHTADPGETGLQNTSEATYTGYARVAVARTSGGWTVTGNSVSPTANIDFPVGTGGTGTATFASIGVGASGATNFLYRGALSPSIAMGNGIIPRITTATTITEE